MGLCPRGKSRVTRARTSSSPESTRNTLITHCTHSRFLSRLFHEQYEDSSTGGQQRRRWGTAQCSQIVDGIDPFHYTSLLQRKQFFKYNLEKFLKYITFSSCSSIIFESLSKLYLKNCFFSIKCQNGGGKFHQRSGSTGTAGYRVHVNTGRHVEFWATIDRRFDYRRHRSLESDAQDDQTPPRDPENVP